MNENLVNTIHSEQNSPAMIAFVDAIAGMMFLTTPWVSDHVTPSILNSFARFKAWLYSQPMCSGSSVSSFLSYSERSVHEYLHVKLRLTSKDSWPLQHGCPLYTVFRKTWSISDGTDREGSGLVEHIQGAFIT